MTNIEDVFGSGQYLKAEDLEGAELELVISKIEIREYEENGYKKRKPVLSFLGTDKKLVCNKTNALMIAEHHGKDIEGWEGKTITLYPTRVDFAGKMTDAIRVRPPAPKARPAGAKPKFMQKQYDERNPPPADLDDSIPF
jgi:hypothetical protein